MLILTSQMLLKSWRGNRWNGIVRVMGMSAKEGVIWLQGFSHNIVTFLFIYYSDLQKRLQRLQIKVKSV